MHPLDHHKMALALIDERVLTRISVSHLLESNACSRGRSIGFIIMPYSSTDEYLSVSIEKGDKKVELIVLNIGAAYVYQDNIREQIEKLKCNKPEIPIAILADRDEPHNIKEALRYGIQGYIPTTLNPSVMVHAFRLIQAGGIYIPTDSILPLLDIEKPSVVKENGADSYAVMGCELTPRQIEVLQLLQKGKSNKLIAYELEMQESTVKVHVRQIMKKLNVTNRTHAALLAARVFANN